MLVEGPDSIHRLPQRGAQGRIDPPQRRLPEAGVEGPGRRRQIDPVEALGVLTNRLIATPADVVEDRAHRVAGGRVVRGPPS